MIETFLKKNWRTVIFVGLALFAWFVWPTPYSYWWDKECHKYRVNRFTKSEESWWPGLGQWRGTDNESYCRAKQDWEESKKKTEESSKSKK